MRFHTDENVAEAVALGLRRRGIDITTTPEAGLLGASDPMQLTYAQRNNRVLISHDTDMLRLAAGGFPHSGVVYCHNQKYKAGELISKLLMLAGCVVPQEMINRVEFL